MELEPLPRKANGLYEAPPLRLVYQLHVVDEHDAAELAHGWKVSLGSVKRWIRLARRRAARGEFERETAHATSSESAGKRNVEASATSVTSQYVRGTEYPRPDSDELRHLYLELDHTQEDLAQRYGVSPALVKRWLRDLNLRKVPRKKASRRTEEAANLDLLECLYSELGLTQKELGDFYGVHFGTIRSRLLKSGIPLHSATERHQLARERKKWLKDRISEHVSGSSDDDHAARIPESSAPSHPGSMALLGLFIGCEGDLADVCELTGLPRELVVSRIREVEPNLLISKHDTEKA